jgi:D-alanine-D-alanine ligase
MERKLRVGVVFGGRSGEHEVSLMSAHSVLAALDRQKYDVIQIGITHEGVWVIGEDVLSALEQNHLAELSPATVLADPTRHGLFSIQDASQGELLEQVSRLDVIFPVLHGTYGEDGTLQGLLEMADLAYVGAGVLASALGMDKGVFKALMRSYEIPIADWIIVSRTEIERNIEGVIAKSLDLGDFPLFVKPANLGSSVGITKCLSSSDLYEGLLEAARFDRRVLVERGIEAREIEVSVLGNSGAQADDAPQASLPGEIIPSREFYSYESKYIDGTSLLLIPARLSPEISQRAQELAIRAYLAIDCSGMARVDFLLDKASGELYLNEVNTIPGFTQISMYPKLWEASGLSYPALIDRLIELALARKAENDRTERRYQREN